MNTEWVVEDYEQYPVSVRLFERDDGSVWFETSEIRPLSSVPAPSLLCLPGSLE